MATVDLTSGFTENDSAGHLAVTASRATITSGSNNNRYNLYKSYGANYFDSLDLDFAIRMNSSAGTDSLLGMGMSNTGTPNTAGADNFSSTDFSCVMYWYTTTRMYLSRGGFASVEDNITTLALDTTYYITISRSAGGDSVSAYIYSDSGRTTLLDTLVVAGFGTAKWQYLFPFVNAQWSSSDPLNGFTEDFDLNEASASGPANLKSYNTNLKANIKSINTNLIANVKSLDTNV